MELFALASLAVVAGVVSFSSPCVLPLLPGYVSYISGLGGAASPGESHRRTVLGASLFVLGFAAVFTALGATATALGLLLAQHLRALNLVGGAVIALMGLAMTGWVRIPLLQRETRPGLARVPGGPAGALPLGAAFGFGWTPCVGPVLASVLVTAAGSATVSRGIVLLLAYSAGLGLPFLLLASGLARGRTRFAWLRRHGRRIEVIGGALMVLTGIAVMTGIWTAVMSDMLAAYARLGWPPI